MPNQGEDTLTGAVSALWCCSPQGGWEYWNMAQGLGVAAGVASGVVGGVVGGCWPCCSLMAPFLSVLLHRRLCRDQRPSPVLCCRGKSAPSPHPPCST